MRALRRWDKALLRAGDSSATASRCVAETRRMLVRQLARPQAPRPVAHRAAGPVHARLAAEAEHVLRGNDCEVRARAERELDQAPARFGRVEAGCAALLRAERPVPAG